MGPAPNIKRDTKAQVEENETQRWKIKTAKKKEEEEEGHNHSSEEGHEDDLRRLHNLQKDA